MPRILFQTEKIRAEWWDEDEWVQIKKLSGAERDRYQAELFVVGGNIDALSDINSATTKFQLAQANTAVVKIGVSEWNLFYQDRETTQRHKMPFTDRYIELLPPKDLDFIVAEIRRFNRGPADDPKSAGRGADGIAGDGAVASGDGTDPGDAADEMELAGLSGGAGVAAGPDSFADDRGSEGRQGRGV